MTAAPGEVAVIRRNKCLVVQLVVSGEDRFLFEPTIKFHVAVREGKGGGAITSEDIDPGSRIERDWNLFVSPLTRSVAKLWKAM